MHECHCNINVKTNKKTDSKDGKRERSEPNQTTCWAHLQLKHKPHDLVLCHSLTPVFNIVKVFRGQKRGKAPQISFSRKVQKSSWIVDKGILSRCVTLP